MGKKVTQAEIARRLGLDLTSVNKILHCVPGLKWRKETVKAVFDTAREIGYDLDKIKFRHNRAYPRVPVDLPATVEIVLSDDAVVDKGTARIKDLSLGGACLAELKLKRDSLPIEPFFVNIWPKGNPSEEPIRSRIKRLYMNGKLEYGIKFENMDSGTAHTLRMLMGI